METTNFSIMHETEAFIKTSVDMTEEQLISVVNTEHVGSRLNMSIAMARLQDKKEDRDKFQTFLDEKCLHQGKLETRGGSDYDAEEYKPVLLLPKSTASEYATMGRTYLHHKAELDKAGFDPAFDMKKLLIIAPLHQKQNIQEADAIAEIRKLSYRDLKEKYEIKKRPSEEGVYIASLTDYEIRYKETTVLTINSDLYERLNGTLGSDRLTGFTNQLRKSVDGLFGKDGAKAAVEGVSKDNPIVSESEKETA